MPENQLNNVIEQLYQGERLTTQCLQISMEASGQSCLIELFSNSAKLLAGLAEYFNACDVINTKPNDAFKHKLKLELIESDPVELDIDFIDWKREPGKTGKKDAYYDFEENGNPIRLVKKVRTGMIFLQSEQRQIAAGPCIANDNQIINFINSQYMNWLQNNDWLICHSSGLVYEKHNQSHGIAMAGLSGGGKSTLMLELLELPEFSYMTNDRLFIIKDSNSESIAMAGIPKLPRINPGTIIGNPKLHSILPADKKAYYQQMPKEKLWDIEEKYDVDISDTYGENKISHQANLNTFIILNWNRNSSEAPKLNEVNINQRHDILPEVMKSPGPFYMNNQRVFEQDSNIQDKADYLKLLSQIKIYEVTGGIDFKHLTKLCLEIFN